MYIDEIIGIVIVVLSFFFAILGSHLKIEILTSVSTFSAGAFTTYVVQHRLQIKTEKRKMQAHMRDTIYGPIFMGLSTLMEKVKTVDNLNREPSEDLEEIMTHYLFFTVKQELRSKLSEILNRVKKYIDFRRATELMLQNIIKTEMAKTYGVDIGANENQPHLSLLVGKIHVVFINLIRTLLLGIEPRDFVRTETEKWGENTKLEVSIGKVRTLSDFEAIYNAVLNEAEKESLYQEEKAQKARLVSEIKTFLEQIEAFVKLES